MERTVEGNWYIAAYDGKDCLVVDHEGCTVADAFNERLARQIVREHNALRAVSPLLPSDVQEKIANLAN